MLMLRAIGFATCGLLALVCVYYGMQYFYEGPLTFIVNFGGATVLTLGAIALWRGGRPAQLT